MSEKAAETQASGGITSGIQKDTIVSKTIAYIWRQLPAWRDDPNRRDEHSENQLNLQLVKFLDAHALSEFSMVPFNHQEYQSGRRSVDLSASPVEPITIGASLHTIYDPILVIEGKRLPAPSPDREREYVSGGKDNVSGGIQRFKLGLHGSDHNIVAMVGYVQERSLTQWHRQINDWIVKFEQGILEDICVWNADEKLDLFEEDSLNGIASSRSVHSRVGSIKSSRIAIHHLWIEMNLNKHEHKGPAGYLVYYVFCLSLGIFAGILVFVQGTEDVGFRCALPDLPTENKPLV